MLLRSISCGILNGRPGWACVEGDISIFQPTVVNSLFNLPDFDQLATRPFVQGYFKRLFGPDEVFTRFCKFRVVFYYQNVVSDTSAFTGQNVLFRIVEYSSIAV